MHIWGDPEFDWGALDEACIYLTVNCRRWARLGVWSKEKYGTMRVVAWTGLYEPIHSFLWPGHWRVYTPRWFRTYIDFPLGDFLRRSKLDRPIYWWQTKVLKFFWKRAAKKWPHIATEILSEYKFHFKEEA